MTISRVEINSAEPVLLNNVSDSDGIGAGVNKYADPMSKKEYRQFVFTATLTAFLVGVIFCAVIIAFTAFCIFVWLK